MPRTENTKKFSEEKDAIDFANTIGKNNVQDIIEDKGLWVVLYYIDVREEGEEKVFDSRETVASKIIAELNEEPEEEDEFVLDEDDLELADEVDPLEKYRGSPPVSPEDLKKAGITEIIDEVQDWDPEELTPEEAEDVLEEVQDKMELEKIMMIEDPVERFQALGYDVHNIMWDPGTSEAFTEAYSIIGEKAKDLIDTGRRFITKKVDGEDKFIASVSHRYALLPNEVMADVGDRVAAMVGARLHQDRSDEKRLYRYYIDDSFPCGPLDADDVGELFPGFLVYNSVDGSMGAGIEPFLYRVVCDNGMMIQMKTAMTLKARHTQGVHDFKRDDFVVMAKNALELSKAIADIQKEWVTIDLSLPENSALVDRLVYAQIPNAYKEECAYLKKPSKRLLEQDIPAIPNGTSLWTAYNALTAAITRPPNDKKVDERTRVDYQHYLHKALMPELQVEA